MNFQTKSKENRIISEKDEIIMVLCSNCEIEEEINKKNCSEKSEKERKKKVKVGKKIKL